MKVLLTQDVSELGLAGEVHVVAGGYARNYLMPRGMAVLATRGALKQAEEIKQTGIRRRARERANAEAQAQVVNGQRLLFQARAGETGRLYGSVTAADIAEKLEEAVGFEVDRRRIHLEHPIRDLGLYTLELRFLQDVTGTFTVGVVNEGEGWAEAEARDAKVKAEAAKAAAKAAEAAQAQQAAQAQETEAAEQEEAAES